MVPIYDAIVGVTSSGNNVEFRVVGWGVVTVVDSNWSGNGSYVKVKKSHMFNGGLRTDDLSAPAAIEGAYGAPALVE